MMQENYVFFSITAAGSVQYIKTTGYCRDHKISNLA